MKTQSVRLENKPGACPISEELALQFFGAEAIEAGEKRFVTKHFGPWQILTACHGLTVTAEWSEEKYGSSHVTHYTLHGTRALNKPKQSGYDLEGSVTIDGKRHTAFTSSILFELPSGKLISVATIHARTSAKLEARADAAIAKATTEVAP